MKKKHPEHVNLERWLVSYADFITLLFAFFVVMYAISQADLAKFKAVSQSLRAAFKGGGDSGSLDLQGQAGGQSVSPFEVIEPPGGNVANLPSGRLQSATEPNETSLKSIREALEESISLELGVTSLSEAVQMHFDSQGLVLRIAAKDFFLESSAEPKSDYQPLLDRIGRVLAGTPRLIRIEGHTDPIEVTRLKNQDTWELSVQRALWVAQFWLKRFDFSPARIGVAGHGHFRPLTKSRTPLEQAENRRVEIIVLNNDFEAPPKEEKKE